MQRSGLSISALKQAQNPPTKLGKVGSGLGLSITHNITANLLGGHIDVASAPGKATRFTLDIPMLAPLAKVDSENAP